MDNSQRFWWHIYIFADTQSQTKNAKEPPANAPRQTKMNRQTIYRQEGRTDNKVLPKAGLNGFDWTFVQGSVFVLRLNFCAKNLRLRQAENR